MKACALLLAVTAITSSGCISYVARQRAHDQKVEPGWAALGLGAELGLGALFGVGLHGANENHPDDPQLSTPAWIAIGTGVLFAFDAIGAILFTADP